jgi:PAS domain S-box-containing protein
LKKGIRTRKQTNQKHLKGDDMLRHLAFVKTAQANIISIVSSGKIIMANNAACKLLGYTKKEFLTKSRAAIFDINESSFKKMLKQRTAEGQSVALVTAIYKSGKLIPCEITSAVFVDEKGIKKSITSISDLSRRILNQKIIDTKKEKIVAHNIGLAKSKQKIIDTRNRKKVAYNIVLAKSRQKHIDTQKEKIVADNIVLAKSRQKHIDTQKEKIVADNIVLAKSKQKIIDTKKEKIVADNIVLAKSKQKIIDTRKEKITGDNIILAQAISDARLAENNEWIQYMAETSYDVMWDWEIASGQIYVGGSIEEVFGWKVKNNSVSFTDFSRCLIIKEKKAVLKKIFKAVSSKKKTWNDSFMFKRYDGSVASTVSRANILRDEKGKAVSMVGAIKDVSRLQELEIKLEEQIILKKQHSEIFRLAAKLSYDGIWDWNILTNDFFLGEGFEELFGYDIKKNKGNLADWSRHLHPDDKEAVEAGLQDAIASSSTKWEHAYRFIKADGSIAKVFGRASIIRDGDGKAYRMIGAIHDLSRQKELEEKLAQEIKLKLKQIEEATEDAKDMERSDIGKELHDNVNQLLGTSRMYLDIAKREGGNNQMYVSRSSEYILTAIEEIRKLTKGMTTDIIKNLGLCEAIKNLTQDTMEASSIKITYELKSFIETSVNDKFKLNVFRIVQEHLNNILKHAKAMEVAIMLSQTKKTIKLNIMDNGLGFDTQKAQRGIGIVNIKSRAASYNGIADFVSQSGSGCLLTVTFPVSEVLLKKG